jgi:hypothetical protein
VPPVPIPRLNRDGLLPVGVHSCTLEEIRQRFGRFNKTDRRIALFKRLEDLITAAAATELVRAVVVDGSFVTAEPQPNDIDLILVVADDFGVGELSPFVYNATSTKRLSRRYKFDVFLARERSAEYHELVAFAQGIRDSDRRKGILRVEL